MKKRAETILVLSILLFLAISMSGTVIAEDWPLVSETVTADVEVNSGIQLKATGNDPYIEFLTANLSFIPLEGVGQSVLRIEGDPEPEYKGEVYSFRWEDPIPDQLFFKIDTRVKTQNVVPHVKKADFPIINLSDEMFIYTQPSDNIDSDNRIIAKKGSELAAGKTDLYETVFEIAEWTRQNVQYNLSTLTAQVSEPASWVMENRKGVCDEITTLFIALLRSVGVPAKFVSGVAYTESPLFPDNWGGHGWAEVYFPGTGWVPFDVTYAQYGWVDPTHIKFQEEVDSGASSLKYFWLGRDVDVMTKPINVIADTVSHSGRAKDFVKLDISMMEKEVGIGSYNLVEATVKNTLDSYVTSFLYLARINELKVDEGYMKAIMLKPKETKKVYWLVKVDDTLTSDFAYTFPMAIANIFNTKAEMNFRVIPGAPVFKKDEVQKIKDAYEKGEEKIFSKDIEIECGQEKEKYYSYDKPKVWCKATNKGKQTLKDLQFCFGGDCSTKDIGPGKEVMREHTFSSLREGLNKIAFRVEGKEVMKTEFYDLVILDEPKVVVAEYNYPEQIEYQVKYSFEYVLKKASASEPVNVTMTFNAAGQEKTIDVGTMKADKKYVFNLNSEELTTKPNKFIVTANYADANGKMYSLREEKEINLINVTFGQKMIIMLKQLDKKIRNIFK